MALETWIAFTTVSFALLVMPGPITLFIVSSTINLGRGRAAAIIPGAMFGDLVAMTASLLGAGIVITGYPMLFEVMKIVGAVILFVIGVRSIVEARDQKTDGGGSAMANGIHLFFGGFALAALHPSGFVFFTAFTPQFIDPSRSFAGQAVLLIMTFLLIVGLTSAAWLLGANHARNLIQKARTLRHLQRCGGVLLVIFAVISAILVLIS